MRYAMLALTLLAFGTIANADPISVSYTITGSSGDWTLDFSVTNNLTAFPSQDMYFFGVLLNGTDIVASPTGWVTDGPWNTATSGSGGTGPNVTFDNTWIEDDANYNLDLPGNTVSGFEAGDTSTAAPTSVEWFAFTYSPTKEEYTGGGNFTYDGLGGINPGFTSLATVGAVPEPSTLPLAGIAFVCSWVIRSRIFRKLARSH